MPPAAVAASASPSLSSRFRQPGRTMHTKRGPGFSPDPFYSSLFAARGSMGRGLAGAGEAIAGAALGQDVAWVLRIIAQLAPQATDIGLEIVRLAAVFVAPDA